MKYLVLLAFMVAFFHSCYTTQTEREKFEPSPTDFMQMEPPPTSSKPSKVGNGTTMVVLKDGLVVRKNPNETSKAINKLSKWEEVVVIATKDGWSRLKSGWVKSSELGE